MEMESDILEVCVDSTESALAAQAVLIAYIPMLMGTGGNSGSQASVAVIRNLSIGELEFSDIFSVMWKEIRVSVLCGVTLAAANFVKLLLVDRMLLGNDEVTALVAAAICITIVFIVFFAKLIGCALPMIAEKLGFDPTVMANPLITTILDALSLLIYFLIARMILGI